MNLIEPLILGCGVVGGVTGVVLTFSSGPLAMVGGFLGGVVAGGVVGPLLVLALGLLFVALVRGPRHAWELLGGKPRRASREESTRQGP